VQIGKKKNALQRSGGDLGTRVKRPSRPAIYVAKAATLGRTTTERNRSHKEKGTKRGFRKKGKWVPRVAKSVEKKTDRR